MKLIRKIGLALMVIFSLISLETTRINADSNRTYQVGFNLKPGRYIVTSKNGTGDIYNPNYDYDFTVTNEKPRGGKIIHQRYHINAWYGQKIITNKFDANFEKDKSPKISKKGNLIYGEYRVGFDSKADIEPGTYMIRPGKCWGDYRVNDEDEIYISGLKKIDDGEYRKRRIKLRNGDSLYVEIDNATLTRIY